MYRHIYLHIINMYPVSYHIFNWITNNHTVPMQSIILKYNAIHHTCNKTRIHNFVSLREIFLDHPRGRYRKIIGEVLCNILCVPVVSQRVKVSSIRWYCMIRVPEYIHLIHSNLKAVTHYKGNVIFKFNLCFCLTQNIEDRGKKCQKSYREKLFETILISSCFQGSFFLYAYAFIQ